ncbi:MAG: trehalase family glycosidase [Bacteroidales bacterium]|nr:trehalase family glycosidase [Bacteroidales bacterium]
MNLKIISFLIVGSIVGLACCKTTEPKETDLQTRFKNVLNIKKIPKDKYDLSAFGFSDMGAWHAYSLPNEDSAAYIGGFCGPLLMKNHGTWLAKKGVQLTLFQNAKAIDYLIDSVKSAYYPGKLIQKLITENFSITQSLIFVDNRTALLQNSITNLSKQEQTFNWQLHSDFFSNNVIINREANHIFVTLKDSSFVCYTFPDDKFTETGDSLNLKINGHVNIQLKAGETTELSHLESYFFSQQEYETKKQDLNRYLEQTEQLFIENTARWSDYIDKVLSTKSALPDSSVYQSLAVKCIETLMSNWRSPAGALKHNGIFPSAAYHGFYGFWSWDSWKHATALSLFNLDLARESIRSMFDFQNEAGMVADCVYQDSTENNWRDTKAPLAAWAVWKIFEKSNDTAFIKEMYPKLIRYHNWWYTNRDVNKNGICEYGSTDGTLIAAKWESGMDNAVRFDNTKLLQSSPTAWSMNQESVDLNVFLQKEKEYLGKMASINNKSEDAHDFFVESSELKEIINNYFWSENGDYFFDYNFETKKHINEYGPEGWLALWTGIADKDKAAKIKSLMMDENRFNTKIPLPTLDAANEKFNPLKGYWRGPVWIDQLWFGIEGLKNYGYNAEAEQLRWKFLTNAEGLLSDHPIRENYHPVTGQGLNAAHFSWSAAHILLMLSE